ncbi:MAG: hypothetical protein KDC24_10910 [Saprospiraceae bacterium]|nr:hypothetical protein [Saprospiraceae bacterium]
MFFKDIIGQEKIKTSLRLSLQDETLPHALLLLGPEGSGGLSLALAMARALVCTDLQEGEPCGVCSGCSKSLKNIHPDIHFSFPTIGKDALSDEFLPQWRQALEENPYLNAYQWLQKIGAEGKQGNITRKECSRIIHKLTFKSFESKNRVLILWMPEYLGLEGNRLLKIIEEPPQDTFFILVAEDQDLILNTILSRCQLVKLPALHDEDIQQALHQKTSISDEKARSIAFLAEGNFNMALQYVQLSEHGSEADNSGLFLDWLRKCYKGEGVAIAKWVDEFAGAGRENQKFFLKYGLHFLREYLFLKTTGRNEVRLLPNELDTAQKMEKVLSLDKVEKMSNLFSDTMYYVERNANPRILFLDASIQMHKIFKNTA